MGLAMDCFAVSTSKGICTKKFKWKYTIRLAFLFGFFQASMPLITFFAGAGFTNIIKDYDHWIAFVLLSLIGIKMLVEGLKPINPDCKIDKHPYRWRNLLVLSLATSIDALATGVIFIPYPESIWNAVLAIGITSFLFSVSGVLLGYKLGRKLKFNMELLGGVFLIGIGLKILLEHQLNL